MTRSPQTCWYDRVEVIRSIKLASSSGFLALLSIAGLLQADVVHLKNGRSMEGVVLEESPDQVMLQLAFGEIGLPRSSISRIERGESALAEYLGQREVLVEQGATAGEWLALAQWACANHLDHSCREAALMAARFDPGLAGLEPLMQEFGYVFDQQLAIWMPFDEMMRRRGYVQSGDRWLSPTEALAKRRSQEEEERNRQEQQRQDRLARAVEMMALARLAEAEESRRRLEETPPYPVGLPIYGGYPIVVPPGHWPGHPDRPRPPHFRPGHRPGMERPEPRKTNHGGILSRSPGSWIPVSPGPSHRGGVKSASESADPP